MHAPLTKDRTLDRRLMQRRQRVDRRMTVRYGATATHRRHGFGRRKEDECDAAALLRIWDTSIGDFR